jgi:hypothetical protein
MAVKHRSEHHPLAPITWVRSPWWDSCWFLSAPLLGLLMLVPLVVPLPTAEISAGIIVLRFAHAISSIVLAWSHRGYRQVMLTNRPKFIGVPALVMLLGLLVGIGTWLLFPAFNPFRYFFVEKLASDSFVIPLVSLTGVYTVWNLYHGGRQNFGFLCLYRGRGFTRWQRTYVVWRFRFTVPWQKVLVSLACVLVTIFVVQELKGLVAFKAVGPFCPGSDTLNHCVTAGLKSNDPRFMIVKVVGLFCFGFVTVNHYLAAIGLAAHIHARHFKCSPMAFVGSTLFVGIWLAFAFFIAMYHSIPWFDVALGLSLSLGLWHFLQDRWTFRFSDPQVRATIGRDLRGRPIMAAA